MEVQPGARRTQTSLVSVYRGEPAVHVNDGATFLVAHQNGGIPFSTGEYGLYADDTRFLAGHELRLNGRLLEPLAFSRLSFRHARWHLLGYEAQGLEEVGESLRVAITVDRVLSSRQLHEDLVVRRYGNRPASLMLTLAVSSDFADIFEVRAGRWQRRPQLTTDWIEPARLLTSYRRDDFFRACLIRTLGVQPGATYANGVLRFPIDLMPDEEWRVCLQYDLLTQDHGEPELERACPTEGLGEYGGDLHVRAWSRAASRIEAGDVRLQFAYEQAVEDFAALTLYDYSRGGEASIPAAGVPWFVALFGRDSEIASLQAGATQPKFALGVLQTLARWQSDVDDPLRDAEPGKMPHELRVGEWAHFGVVPHRPYYGTADATSLYLLVLAQAYRTLDHPENLSAFRATAERCLEWIDRYGDRDGDGFQEWAPRSLQSYRNQSWRDAEDGVLDPEGGFPEHPIAGCELQAYVYGAKLAVAPLFAAWGDEPTAQRLRDEAADLRRRFLDAFWLDPPGQLAFVLDGQKRALNTAVSNPGHCLWMGILDRERGLQAGERLLWPDLFSGWGLRTLSDRHPAYDPHSYQRGSVWPHDTVIAAAGLRRYGLIEKAWQLLEGLLGAVMSFEYVQMPELFSGLPRSPRGVPVPYRYANVPQAWGAGAVLHMVRILLGLEPDLPAGRVYVDPALPPWCPRLAIENVQVGRHLLRVEAWRQADGSSTVDVAAPPDLEVVTGTPPWLGLAEF